MKNNGTGTLSHRPVETSQLLGMGVSWVLSPRARTGENRRVCSGVNDHSPTKLQAGLRESAGEGSSSAGTLGSLRDTRTESLPSSCHSEVSKKIAKSTNKDMNTFHGDTQLGSIGPSHVSDLGCGRHSGQA